MEDDRIKIEIDDGITIEIDKQTLKKAIMLILNKDDEKIIDLSQNDENIPVKMSNEQRLWKKIQLLYEQDYSKQEIMEKLGITLTQVNNGINYFKNSKPVP